MDMVEWHDRFCEAKRRIRVDTEDLFAIADAMHVVHMHDLATDIAQIAASVQDTISGLDLATGAMIHDTVQAEIEAMHETLAACIVGAIEHVEKEK